VNNPTFMLVSCVRSHRSCTSLSTKKEGGEDDKEEKYLQVGVACVDEYESTL